MLQILTSYIIQLKKTGLHLQKVGTFSVHKQQAGLKPAKEKNLKLCKNEEKRVSAAGLFRRNHYVRTSDPPD
jgi:hypothetical protein